MQIRTIVNPSVVRAEAAEPLVALARRMREHGISSLPVYEGERLVGILAERDVVAAVAGGVAATAIASAWMTRHPVTASPEDDSAERELAHGLGAAVLVVHVSDGSLAEHEPDTIAAAAAGAIGPDCVAAVRVRAAGEGGVASVLQAEAADYDAGLLAVGRRGRSPLQRLLLGGVSERLLDIAPCPLLVARPPNMSDVGDRLVTQHATTTAQ